MFQGSIVPLVTPFLEDETIDWKAFRRLIGFHIEQGTDALVIAGTTGESSCLSCSEQIALIQEAVREARGRIPIIAGTGSNRTSLAVERTKKAVEAGADGCLVIFPYYNRPTFEGCRLHFQKIGEIGLPMILYHHPGRTGVGFSGEQLAELCSLPGACGLKEASGNVEAASDFIRIGSVPLFVGDDSLVLPLIAAGARGAISITGNLRPGRWADFIQRALSDDLQGARDLYASLAPICEAMVLETNPQCIKYAMSLEGHCLPFLRLPLVLPKPDHQEKIRRLLGHVDG